METYQVSALRFRPQTFEEVVGQEAITQTLQHAVAKFLLDGHSRPVADLLACSGQKIEKGSFAAIRVANQSNFFHRPIGSVR